MNRTAEKIVYEVIQECISRFPVIILGSGASAAHGIPGMPSLKNHLMAMKLPESFSPNDKGKWKEVLKKLETTDIETALNEIVLSDELTNYVIESTWDFLTPYDYDILKNAIINHDHFPLTKLFQHLFNSTKTDIHVVTSNYDRLAEYAADKGGLAHYTGFTYGHIRARAVEGTLRIYNRNSRIRTVNIWKVHGSLDWFYDDAGVAMGLPVTKSRPDGVLPVIITPGIDKYRLTHEEPYRSIKSEADKALQSADAYLCIGYGFNDSHLQTTLVERCRGKNVPLVLITETISDAAKIFLKSGKCSHYLAIEKSSDGSKIYSMDFPDGEEIINQSIWQLENFLEVIIS